MYGNQLSNLFIEGTSALATKTSVRFTLGEYLRPGSHKIAWSLPELVKSTNEFSTKNQGGCTPKLTGSNPKELFLHYNVKCSLKTSDPAGHDVKVRFDLAAVTDETKANDLNVECSCSCPAFLYWGAQWNLHQRDSLEGEPRPLFTAPTERLDLRSQFLICKHVKVVMDRILPSVQHNIVKIIRQRTVDKNKKKMQETELPPVPKRKPMRKAPAPPPPTKRIIKRDAPATPEEKKRVPVIPAEDVVEPSTAREPVVEETKLTPIPMIDDLDDIAETPAVPANKPVKPTPLKAPEPPPEPKAPARKPAKPQQMTQQDRDFMKRLQRDEQRRLERKNQQRMKTNPGFRR